MKIAYTRNDAFCEFFSESAFFRSPPRDRARRELSEKLLLVPQRSKLRSGHQFEETSMSRCHFHCFRISNFHRSCTFSIARANLSAPTRSAAELEIPGQQMPFNPLRLRSKRKSAVRAHFHAHCSRTRPRHSSSSCCVWAKTDCGRGWTRISPYCGAAKLKNVQER